MINIVNSIKSFVKSVCVFSLLIMLLSCNKEKYKYTHYESGNIKTKFLVNDKKMNHGLYEEYYESEKIKLKTKYTNGKILDTVFCYYENGYLKEKGLMFNGLKHKWWKLYDIYGKFKGLEEYVLIDNGKTSYKNQVKNFDQDKIDYDDSSFFEIKLKDTLYLGKNMGKVFNYSNSKADVKYLYIIIDNEYSDSEIIKDTFAESSNQSRFGVYARKVGSMKVRGTIEEKLVSKVNEKTDSSKLVVKSIIKYFEKEVYVKDSISK